MAGSLVKKEHSHALFQGHWLGQLGANAQQISHFSDQVQPQHGDLGYLFQVKSPDHPSEQ
jgi:hypothetical protein